MYSPYLHARQSELLALRAVLREGGDLSGLIPVLEPVFNDSSGLLRCMAAFDKAAQPIVVLTNPYKHEFKGVRATSASAKTFHAELSKVLKSQPSAIPAYRVDTTTTYQDTGAFLKAHPSSPVALIYESPSLRDSEVDRLAKDPHVAYHIVLGSRIAESQLRLLPKAKLVETIDGFNRLARNADYSGKEIFSDRHKSIGRSIAAVGDYAVIGSSLELGGGKPGAVAIHLTYKQPQSSAIWIEHFVSDETDRDVGNAESKFLDAAAKSVRAAKGRRAEFGRNFALDEYARHVSAKTFPGLPKNKEHQIHHHIRLMLDITQGKL
jgi:hypothetical protein